MVDAWKPITDLPQDWASLTSGELGPLLQFWNDQRADLEQSGALEHFTQRLAREWAIETGQIEGVYDIDRGITETLIARGINADLIPTQPGQKLPELIAAIIQDHIEVLDGLFQFVKGDRPLSKSYIHELHAALLRHQDTTAVLDQFRNLFESKLLKGKYKERPNNPRKLHGGTHHYCPPEQVEPEMERLLALHHEHEKQGVPVELEAAWLHHRFTQIHPYQDGNGRVARALASLVFIKRGWFPLVVTRDNRARYLDALEVADESNLGPLVSFFVRLQEQELSKAMSATPDPQPIHTVDDAIASAKRVLGFNKEPDPAIWVKAKDIADQLMNVAAKRLTEIAATLKNEIGKNRLDSDFTVLSWAENVPELLPLPYKPNTTDYNQSQILSISASIPGRPGQAYIEIYAHAIGSRFRGIIGIVPVFTNYSVRTMTCKEPFQVNYAEPYESAERRFQPWLEESLVNALTLWRRTL